MVNQLILAPLRLSAGWPGYRGNLLSRISYCRATNVRATNVNWFISLETDFTLHLIATFSLFPLIFLTCPPFR